MLQNMRRQRRAVGLVQAVVERARQRVEIAGRERVHEQRGALQAVDGVGARHLGPQHACATPWCRARDPARTSTNASPAGGSMRRSSGRSPSSASVKPPAIAAATLSGCPSSGAASAISSSVPCGWPWSASAAASPATIAALDEPVPACSGTALLHAEREPVERPVPDLRERAHDEVRGVGGQRPGALAAHAAPRAAPAAARPRAGCAAAARRRGSRSPARGSPRTPARSR